MNRVRLTTAVVLVIVLGACSEQEPTYKDYEQGAVLGTSAVGYGKAFSGDALIVDTAHYAGKGTMQLPDLNWRVQFEDVIDKPSGECVFSLSDGVVKDIFLGVSIVRPCSYDRDETISFTILKDEFAVTGRLAADANRELLGPAYVVKRFEPSATGITFLPGFEPWSSGSESSNRVQRSSVGYHEALGDEAVIIETMSYSKRFLGTPLKQVLRWRFEFTGKVADPKGLCEFTLISGYADDKSLGRSSVEVLPCSSERDLSFTTRILGDSFTVTGHVVRDPHAPEFPSYFVTRFDQTPDGFQWLDGDEPLPSPGH